MLHGVDTASALLVGMCPEATCFPVIHHGLTKSFVGRLSCQLIPEVLDQAIHSFVWGVTYVLNYVVQHLVVDLPYEPKLGEPYAQNLVVDKP